MAKLLMVRVRRCLAAMDLDGLRSAGSPNESSHLTPARPAMLPILQCGYNASDVYLHAAPLFHIGGLCSALAMLAAGARHVFLPRFDGPALLAAIRQHSVTSFIAGGCAGGAEARRSSQHACGAAGECVTMSHKAALQPMWECSGS